jgi:aspartyl-tRNA(Asn)/glutamyl-tRNA(Gln) amidotransferase subunit A
VAEAAAAYRSGHTTPGEVLEAVLRRVEDVNPAINAIATLDAEGARAAASESGARYWKRQPLGPLDGVVITVKDNIPVANLPCTWGTEIFRDFVPTRDETPVARLRAGGAIILAKTAVSEFSNGRGIVSTPLFGTTRNPWNLLLTTGSSSGGAAAAVASGIGAAALATDGGGSIRIPASNCGLFGLKPSAGQVARAHGLPVLMNGQEVIGSLARCALDLDLMMRIIAGPDDEDAASWQAPTWPDGELSPPGKPRRILHVPKIDGKTAMPEVDIACRRIADVLRALGHHVETGQLPFRPEDIATARTTTRAGMAWLLRDKHWRGRTDDFYVGVTEAGEKMSAVDYVEATAAARRVQAAAGLFFRDYDLVLTPVGTLLPGPADIAIQGDYTIFTSFGNIAGLPAISIPAELSSGGIPIGFQLTGRFGSDRVLLQIALQYEQYRAASGDTWMVSPPIERARL